MTEHQHRLGKAFSDNSTKCLDCGAKPICRLCLKVFDSLIAVDCSCRYLCKNDAELIQWREKGRRVWFYEGHCRNHGHQIGEQLAKIPQSAFRDLPRGGSDYKEFTKSSSGRGGFTEAEGIKQKSKISKNNNNMVTFPKRVEKISKSKFPKKQREMDEGQKDHEEREKLDNENYYKGLTPLSSKKIVGKEKSCSGYYDCLADRCRKKIKGSITQGTRFCKIHKSTFSENGSAEVNKLLDSYIQMGFSLKNLLGEDIKSKSLSNRQKV